MYKRQDPEFDLKSSILAKRKPLPGENKDMASRMFVLPIPFGPEKKIKFESNFKSKFS